MEETTTMNTPRVAQIQIKTKKIEIKILAEAPQLGHSARHFDFQLTPLQAQTLRRITEGLQGTLARTSNGRVIASGADAFRYILDELAR